MSKNHDFEDREAKTRAFLYEQAKRAIAFRSKDREFHGLEREFLYHQAQMLADYERSRDLKHPRDLGDARENILRSFMQVGGYIPKRYSLSEQSVRVVSTTGHISNEIDIALYDPIDSLTLMKRQDVYEVHPVESVYGVIQVKSILTKKELQSGLKNLASFKKLDRTVTSQQVFSTFKMQTSSSYGFALLFAYSSDMKWMDIINELKVFTKANSPRNWPNAVFVLDRGFFLLGEKDGCSTLFNEDIEKIQSLQIYGNPDRTGLCLYDFQSILLNLLRHTTVKPAQLEPYFRLPLVSEEHSYNFVMGAFAEIGHCDQHGDFARKISSKALDTLISWCSEVESINWIKATHIAYGCPVDEDAYRRQPGDVHIYNPEELPFNEILLQDDDMMKDRPSRSLAFDMIDAAGMSIWLPYYYSAKYGLISSCPKCAKPAKPRRRKSAKLKDT